MSLFIEVSCLEKGCTVMLNMEKIVEIVPMKDGTTTIYLDDSTMKVKESYTQFRQFAVQTVTPEDIANRIKNLPKVNVNTSGYVTPEPRLPELEKIRPINEEDKEDIEAMRSPIIGEQKRGPGRPPKSTMMTSSALG